MFNDNNDETSYFKKLKNSYILVSVAYVVFGLCLAINPATSSQLICMIIGILCVVYSLAAIITYFASPIRRTFVELNFILPLITGVFGLVIIISPGFVISILPVIIGIALLVSGVIKLQDGFTLKKLNYTRWNVVVIFAVISVVFGIVMLVHPFGTGLLFIRIAGIFFVFDGIFSIYSSVMIKRNGRS